MNFIVFLVLSYLAGSIPFGKIIAQRKGVDIQKKGSGNIGFTNSLRLLGLTPAILVLLGDILKGFIPAKLAISYLPLDQALIVALFAVFGHIFPVWLKFKGGKGVASAYGAILAINPQVAVIATGVFIPVFLATKIVSISSLISSWSLPIIGYFLYPNFVLFLIVLVVTITLTHKSNIARIISGNEKTIS